MHILFVDESGTVPPPEKTNTRHFVLGGVVISDDVWWKAKNDLDSVKRRYGVRGEIKWRYFTPNNTKPENTLAHLDGENRNLLRQEIFAIINKYKSIRLMASIAHVTAAYRQRYIRNKDDLYTYAFKLLAERFQYFLQDLGREAGIRVHGLIVCDHRNTREDRHLRNYHYRMISADSPFTSKFTNLIEGLFLAPSHHSVGIQFADIVAGALFRHFGSFLNALRPSFRSAPDGRLDGYGIARLPKSEWPSDAGEVI